MEAPQVGWFRNFILEGQWAEALAYMDELGVKDSEAQRVSIS
jgi:hypothetical protein